MEVITASRKNSNRSSNQGVKRRIICATSDRGTVRISHRPLHRAEYAYFSMVPFDSASSHSSREPLQRQDSPKKAGAVTPLHLTFCGPFQCLHCSSTRFHSRMNMCSEVPVLPFNNAPASLLP